MSGELVVRDTWWGRITRALTVLLRPAEHAAGADYVEGVSARPGYELDQAMSAYAGQAWVKACADAVSEDLAGLPIRVRRGSGPTAVRLDAHPILDLLAQPTPRTGGLQFRRQLVVDNILTGNAIVGLYGGAASPSGFTVTRPPTALYRWHPHRVTIRPSSTGEPEAYEHNGAGTIERLPWSLVMHWRGASWEDGVESLFGTGAIRALHGDLSADIAATRRLADSARQGRPQAVASPAGDDAYSAAQVEEAAASMRRAFQKADGGVAVLGQGYRVDVLGWTPRDMEYPALRTWVRDTILAVFGVPPTRVGLPMANYATANQQERGYWQGLQQRAAGLDAELTRIARMFPRSDDIEVYHDFAAVAALQEDRTIRLQRVIDMVTMLGAEPADAAAYEGLDDLPVGEVVSPASPSTPAGAGDTRPPPPSGSEPDHPEPTPDPTPQDAQRAAPQGEVERAKAWRSWVARVQGRHERLIRAAMVRHLRDLRASLVAAMRDAPERSAAEWVARDFLGDVLGALLGAQEAERLRASVGQLLRNALRGAFRAAARELPGDVTYDPSRAGEDVVVGEFITRVTETTRAAVERVVRGGMANGLTMNEIAAELERMPEFGPARALTVARTESNRVANRGAEEAAREADRVLGGGVQLEWLTARDEAVRDAHVGLDGVRVSPGQPFRVGSHTARHPGDFGVAELDINCRCTTVPVVGD